MSELLSIMGLKLSSEEIDDLRYGKIVIMTDMDTDGDCICGLLINLLFKFWPKLFTEQKVYRALSPIVKAKHIATGIIESFYTLNEFDINDYDIIEYNKGLGSLSEAEYKKMLSSLSIIEVDESTKDSLEIAFGDDAALRKDWMGE